MIYGAINILILSLLLLVVGLWRPKIPFFWVKKPTRFAIIMLFSVMAMIGVTMFAEGSRQKQLEEKTKLAKKLNVDKETAKATITPPADIPKINEEKTAIKAVSPQINKTENVSLSITPETEKNEALNIETP